MNVWLIAFDQIRCGARSTTIALVIALGEAGALLVPPKCPLFAHRKSTNSGVCLQMARFLCDSLVEQ